jgi:hypothetical protein
MQLDVVVVVVTWTITDRRQPIQADFRRISWPVSVGAEAVPMKPSIPDSTSSSRTTGSSAWPLTSIRGRVAVARYWESPTAEAAASPRPHGGYLTAAADETPDAATRNGLSGLGDGQKNLQIVLGPAFQKLECLLGLTGWHLARDQCVGLEVPQRSWFIRLKHT